MPQTLDLELTAMAHGGSALGRHEADMLREGSILVTFLHPAAPVNHSMIRTLRDRGVTSLTMDSIPRIPRAIGMDALSSMSLVTGYKSVILAAASLPRFVTAFETPIGTIMSRIARARAALSKALRMESVPIGAGLVTGAGP